ncbi:MAG: leucine-rich repeat domain-containing protein [Treponema sp.]|nr:leucine-rich repeat domain-containing protein [Treponema sp.]
MPKGRGFTALLVTIPGSVASVGGGACYGCTSLVSVTIPGSVASIGNYAFYRCSSLAGVTFGAGSTIRQENFASSGIFPGDLRAKYFAPGGGQGTYTATRQTNDNYAVTWRKQ